MSIESTTPLIHYFECGNIFSGSDHMLFPDGILYEKRYKIFPEGEKGQSCTIMHCKVWMGQLCLEKTDSSCIAEKSFDVTNEGRKEMIDWITAFDGTIDPSDQVSSEENSDNSSSDENPAST